MTTLYGIIFVVSLLMIAVYFFVDRKRDVWLLLLFACVAVCDLGYFLLSVANNLEFALWANRIAYLGSIFLPFSILMMIMNLSRFAYPKCLPGILIGNNMIMFFIASSGGWLPIYYKNVSFEIINGVGTLVKEYGPLHNVYKVFLFAYFSAMIGFIFYAIVKKKISNSLHAVILLSATFVNIAVWFAEQLVHIDFEFLSVSYIITEIFLLLLTLLMQEASFIQPVPVVVKPEVPVESDDSVILEAPDQEMLEKGQYLVAQLPTLTPTEKMIYDYYLEGRAAKEILVLLDIKENTLKYHNKNIYSKLGVSSRKQMIELACFMSAYNKSLGL